MRYRVQYRAGEWRITCPLWPGHVPQESLVLACAFIRRHAELVAKDEEAACTIP